MKLHEHHSYVLKQHRKSIKLWSAIIRIITEGKSLIMKLVWYQLFPCFTREHSHMCSTELFAMVRDVV